MNEEYTKQFEAIKQELSLYELHDLKRNAEMIEHMDGMHDRIDQLFKELSVLNERITALSKKHYTDLDWTKFSFDKMSDRINEMKKPPRKRWFFT